MRNTQQNLANGEFLLHQEFLKLSVKLLIAIGPCKTSNSHAFAGQAKMYCKFKATRTCQL